MEMNDSVREEVVQDPFSKIAIFYLEQKINLSTRYWLSSKTNQSHSVRNHSINANSSFSPSPISFLKSKNSPRNLFSHIPPRCRCKISSNEIFNSMPFLPIKYSKEFSFKQKKNMTLFFLLVRF